MGNLAFDSGHIPLDPLRGTPTGDAHAGTRTREAALEDVLADAQVVSLEVEGAKDAEEGRSVGGHGKTPSKRRETRTQHVEGTGAAFPFATVE